MDWGWGGDPDEDLVLWLTTDFFEPDTNGRPRGDGGKKGRGKRRHRWIPVDFVEEDNQYEVLADIPGVDKSDISVTVEGDTLTIGVTPKQAEQKEGQESTEQPKQGQEKKEEPQQSIRKYHRHERRRDFVHRSLRMPDDADLEHIKAKYENGVLKLTIPRTGQQKTHQISVE